LSRVLTHLTDIGLGWGGGGGVGPTVGGGIVMINKR
jgi:hypothetical protein